MGIALLIVCSFYPPVYYGMSSKPLQVLLCHPTSASKGSCSSMQVAMIPDCHAPHLAAASSAVLPRIQARSQQPDVCACVSGHRQDASRHVHDVPDAFAVPAD